MLGIEAWITVGPVSLFQMSIDNISSAAGTFCDIFTGKFKMYATGNGFLGPVDLKEQFHRMVGRDRGGWRSVVGERVAA